MSNSTEIYKPESTNQENIIDDSKLTQLAPAVHIFAALHFWFSYIYDWLYVVYPPTIMREAIGGKLKYMTYWDVILQAIYFSICVVNDICGSNEVNPRKKPLIREVKDYIYATVAFPVAMFVGVQFWILMFIDRELVLPKAMDEFFPTWLNHVMHTNIMIFTCIEMFTAFRKYPARGKGITGLLLFMLTYLAWLHIIYAVSNIWVYPVLEVLNWWQRVVFFLFGTGLILGMYFVGEFVNRQVWGKTLQQLETGKSRKKTK